MATKYTKDELVKVNSVIPEGPVVKLRMDEDGNFFYLLSWTDADGTAQQRWFAEADLTKA